MAFSDLPVFPHFGRIAGGYILACFFVPFAYAALALMMSDVASVRIYEAADIFEASLRATLFSAVMLGPFFAAVILLVALGMRPNILVFCVAGAAGALWWLPLSDYWGRYADTAYVPGFAIIGAIAGAIFYYISFRRAGP